MINHDRLIALLEEEWELDTGFLGRLRQGQFDREAYGRFTQSLECIRLETTSEQFVPRPFSCIDMVYSLYLLAGKKSELVGVVIF